MFLGSPRRKVVPRPFSVSVVRVLLERYYGGRGEVAAEPHISSHWRHFSSTFTVELSPEGAVLALSGLGAGEWRWRTFARAMLDLACIAVHLLRLPHRGRILRLLLAAGAVCLRMGLHPTLDVFRQVCTLELLTRHLPRTPAHPLRILMIGDGYGVLSALAKSAFPSATLVLVDLGRTLLFQAYHCQRAFPSCQHDLVSDSEGSMTNPHDGFVYCPAEELDRLRDWCFDLAVSVAAMQEMNPPTVKRYFDFLRHALDPTGLFYCCSRESKTLVGGEVSEFLRYPWQREDRVLVDGSCPWHQFFFSFKRARRGPSVFGRRIPLVNYYDGVVRHRLAIMARSRSSPLDFSAL